MKIEFHIQSKDQKGSLLTGCGKPILKLTSHSILRCFWSSYLSKSFSQLIVSISRYRSLGLP